MAVAKDGNTGGSLLYKTPVLPSLSNTKNVTASGSAPTPPADVVAQNPSSYINTSPGPDAPVDPAPVHDEAWVAANDGRYQAQKAALENARNAAIAKLNSDFNAYDVDYGNSLRKLGFTGDQHALDTAKFDPTTGTYGTWNDSTGNPLTIAWDETDQNTAAGRGLNNILNDFAARGMAQSTAYRQARSDLFRSLNDQLSSTAQARNKAFADTNSQIATQRQSADDAITQALREAVARNAGTITG